MTEFDAKLIATLVLAVICLILMRMTNGERGIGWFVLGLFGIWR